MKVEDARCLPTDFCFPNLQRYDINIGPDSGYLSSIRAVRRLELCGSIKDVMINTCKKLFPTVQVFHLSKCDDLYSLPSFSLQELERLEVRRCEKVEWVLKVGNVSNNGNSIVQILSLKILYLSNLCELRHIWEGPTRLLSLCNLTEVGIYNCPKLICIFSSPSLATSLQQLKILRISMCSNLEEIFPRRGGSDDDDFTCFCFRNLRDLEVTECGRVKTIFPLMKSKGRAQNHLPKLQEIVLRDNFLLEHIFGHQTQAEEGVYCPYLQVLKVKGCPNISMTHFVATQLQPPSSKSYKDNYSMSNIQIVEGRLQSTIICFSFLNRVKLKDCNKLKQVFTTSIVTSLHLLDVLTVRRCNELEQVISRVEDGKEEPTVGVCFENLKTLRVSHCGKLKTIFPISIALPKLGRLELKSNAELEHVFGRSDWDCTWQCPFLKDLCLEGCPKLCTEFAACIQNRSTTEVVKKIKLAHKDDDLVTSPFKNLSSWNSEDVKRIQRGPTQNIWFADLYQIKVVGCHKLKHLFTTKVATNFPNLKRLIVRRCNELEEVIMVEDGKKERENDATTEMIVKVGFEKLEVIHVSNCKKLKTVFSTFIPLPSLLTLLLRSNAVLESLFGRSDCDCTLHWTYLNVLSVTGCPKLCTKTVAVIKSQLQVQSTAKRLWFINLSSIQGVEELIQIPRQEGTDQLLRVEELGDLKKIWSGPTQDISFSFLYAVKVIGCSRLKQLFTTTMATCLHNLQLLWVERCHDLEQIIQEDGNEENNTQLELSNLDALRLIDLPNLISFCPTSCNLLFTKLTEDRLKVNDCPQPITDFFSKQSYQEMKESECYYTYEGKDEEEEDGKFNDEIRGQYCTYKYAWELLGRRYEN